MEVLYSVVIRGFHLDLPLISFAVPETWQEEQELQVRLLVMRRQLWQSSSNALAILISL